MNRLRVIGQSLDRGHTLSGIGELLSAWKLGYGLADLLGFERAITARWSDEVLELVISNVLDRRSGAPPPHEVARLTETIERLRPIARTALDAEFGRAMDNLRWDSDTRATESAEVGAW